MTITEVRDLILALLPDWQDRFSIWAVAMGLLLLVAGIGLVRIRESTRTLAARAMFCGCTGLATIINRPARRASAGCFAPSALRCWHFLSSTSAGSPDIRKS